MHRVYRGLLVAGLVLVGGSESAHAVLLSVPSYEQCDGAWGSDQLGTCSETMCSAGCAVTSTAMVFEYFGGNRDPGELNTCLTNNGGYASGCLIYWSNNCMPSGVSYNGTTGDIDNALSNGRPVIAHVTSSQTSMHFVVIIGNNGGQYQINDPGWNYQTISDGGYTIQGLRFYSGNVVVCECDPGDPPEERDCGYCGTETRACQSDCTWGDWSTCQDEGVCEADSTESCGDCGTRTCSQTCQWDDCDDPCGDDAGVAQPDSAVQADGAMPADAAVEEDGAVGPGPDADDDPGIHIVIGGCDCRTGSPGADPLPWALLVLFLGLLWRRRASG